MNEDSTSNKLQNKITFVEKIVVLVLSIVFKFVDFSLWMFYLEQQFIGMIFFFPDLIEY